MKKLQLSACNENNGREPTEEELSSFVPMTELSIAHLKSATRLSRVLMIPEGQLIADRQLLQSHYIYVLSGRIGVRHIDPSKREYMDAGEGCTLALGERFANVPSISAQSDCQILLVEREVVDSMLCWDQVAKSLMLELTSMRDRDEDREWLQTLLMSNLFHKLPPYNIHRVVDRFESRVVQTGEVIIREGERGDECFLIKEGDAAVTVIDSSSQQPRQVATLGPGQCFGEDAMVNMTVRNASVTMLSNGVLMGLKKREFLALMSEPKIESVPLIEAEAKVKEGGIWLDVRSQQEFDFYHRENAFHLPIHLMVLKSRLMDKNQRYFAYCSTGRRAATAAYLLGQQGFDVTPVRPQTEHLVRVAS